MDRGPDCDDDATSRQPKQSRYWAFVSYSSRDRKWADRLVRFIERYRVPRALRRKLRAKELPARLYPLFQDRNELPASDDLTHSLQEAMDQSRHLIAICSPYSAASKWVNEEISYFMSVGRSDRILPLIVDGEPYASFRPESGLPEAFPPVLRSVGGGMPGAPKGKEYLAADVRPAADGERNAFLKIVAGMLGVGFDELYQRDRARRRRWWIGFATAIVTAVIVTSAVYVIQQRLSDSRILAAEATSLLESRPEEGLSTALRAARLFHTPEAEDVLRDAIRIPSPKVRLLRSNADGSAYTVKDGQECRQRHHVVTNEFASKFSSDGRYVFTGDTLRRADTYEVLWLPRSCRASTQGYATASFNRNTSKIALGRVRGTIIHERMVQTGEVVRILSGHRDHYFECDEARSKRQIDEFKPVIQFLDYVDNGATLISAGTDGLVIAWRGDSTVPGILFESECAAVPRVRVSASEELLAIAAGRTFVIMDLANRRELVRFQASAEEAPYRVAEFMEDDQALLITDQWGRVFRVDLSQASAEPERILEGDLLAYEVVKIDLGTQILGRHNGPDPVRAFTLQDVDDGKIRSYVLPLSLRASLNFDHTALSPDGRLVAMSAWNSERRVASVHVWFVAEPDEPFFSTAEMSHVLNFGFTAEGALFVDRLDSVDVWPIRPHPLSLGLEDPIRAKATTAGFDPAGGRLAAGYSNGIVRVWDVATGRSLHRFRDTMSNVHDLRFGPSGRRLAAVSEDFALRVYDLETEEKVTEVILPNEGRLWPNGPILQGARSVKFSADGMKLLMAGSSGTVGLHDLASDTTTTFVADRQQPGAGSQLRGSFYGTFAAKFRHDSDQILTAGADGRLRIWQSDGVLVDEVKLFSGNSPEAIFEMLEAPVLGVAVAGNSMINLHTLSPERLQGDGCEGGDTIAYSADLSPDGSTLAFGLATKKICLWSLPSTELVRPIDTPGLAISHIEFSPDGRTLLASGGGEIVLLLDVKSGDRVSTFRVKPDSRAIFSPSGKLVAVLTETGEIELHPVSMEDLIEIGAAMLPTVVQ